MTDQDGKRVCCWCSEHIHTKHFEVIDHQYTGKDVWYFCRASCLQEWTNADR